MKIPFMCQQRPQNCHQNLKKNGSNTWQNIRQLSHQHRDNQINDSICHKCSQHLTVNHLRNAVQRNKKRIIYPGKYEINDHKNKDHHPIAPAIKRNRHPLRIITIPATHKRNRDTYEIDQFHQPKQNIMHQAPVYVVFLIHSESFASFLQPPLYLSDRSLSK